jgi:hypothetical protein
MALLKTPLILMIFLLVGQPSQASLMTCERLFDGELKAPKTKVVISGDEINERIKAYRAQFARREDSQATRIRFDSTRKLMDGMTNLLVELHSHSNPFTYIRDGSVLKVRLWAKTGDPEILEEIERWIHRYGTFSVDRRLVVERTAFIHLEAEALEGLLRRPEADFPIAIDIPKYNRNGIQSDSVIFDSRAEVAVELSVLKRSENLRFDSFTDRDFSRGRFLRGREHEQGRLESLLQIVLQELKKLPLSTRDPGLRNKLIGEIESSLANQKLMAPSESRYVESRRALTDELGYFSGHRDISPVAENLVDRLFFNDLDDLGIDREKMGLISRFGRSLVLQTPKLVAGLLVLSAVPALKFEIKTTLFRESYMQEIANLPTNAFQEKSFEFLKKAYGVHLENGQLIYSARAHLVMDHLHQLREEHLAELKKEKISQSEFSRALSMGETASLVTGPEFRSLMLMPDARFKESAIAISQRAKTADGAHSLLARLQQAREDYKETKALEAGAAKAGEPSKTDAIISAFSGFLLGGATSAEEKGE